MTTAAFALIDQNHQVVRSTDGFRGLGVDVSAAWEDRPELHQVLNGQADCATLDLGEASFSIDAVIDAAGKPHALVSTSQAGDPEGAPVPDDPVARLLPLLDESQAIAWVKDLSGRHLYVNARCLEALGMSEDRLLGRTDAELSPHETVDGPRLSLAQEGIDEPEELEYTVPALGARGALAAIRFAIRDAEGNTVAICGLAGPLENARMVREEAGRVARSEPSDPAGARADLLDEWGLALGSPGAQDSSEPDPPLDVPAPHPEPAEDPAPPTASFPAEPELGGQPPASSSRSERTRRWDEVVQRLQQEARGWQEEVDQVHSVVERAEAQAREALDERDAAYLEGEQARRERDELAQALAGERERTEELTRVIEQLRSQIADVGRTLNLTLPATSADTTV